MNTSDQTAIKNNPQSRRNFPRIKVSCSPEEKKEIEANAKKAGYSSSAYLRLIGLNYHIKAPVDLERVKDLICIKGDLNRAGGLLKLWLTKETLQEKFQPEHIHSLLHKIEESSDEISLLLKEIRRKHTKPRREKSYETTI